MLKHLSYGVEWFGDRILSLSIVITFLLALGSFWDYSLAGFVVAVVTAAIVTGLTFWITALVFFVLYAIASVLVECLESIFGR